PVFRPRPFVVLGCCSRVLLPGAFLRVGRGGRRGGRRLLLLDLVALALELLGFGNQALLHRRILLGVGLQPEEDVLEDQRLVILGIDGQRLVFRGEPRQHIFLLLGKRQFLVR